MNHKNSVRVSIVEDYTELQKTNFWKSINVEKCREDLINPSGVWETYIEYGDYAKDILMGYLVLTKGESKVPPDYSFISSLQIEEDASHLNNYQRIIRQQTYTYLLLESAEAIAKEEHESFKIAVDYDSSSLSTFKRYGYRQEEDLLTKELDNTEQTGYLNELKNMDLAFDENKYLIENPVDPDAAEKEWLRNYDADYRRHRML